MATERKSTIRAAGGDYPSLSAWQADFGAAGGVTSADLVANDEIAVAECYDDWPEGLPDQVSLSGWITDADHYPKITVAPGNAWNDAANGALHQDHTQATYDGFTMKWTENSSVILADVAYAFIERVRLCATLSTSGVRVIAVSSNADYTVIQYSDLSNPNRRAIDSLARPVYVFCSTVESNGDAAVSYDRRFPSSLFYNVIAIDSDIGFNAASTSSQAQRIQNCVTFNCNTDARNLAAGSTITNNATTKDAGSSGFAGQGIDIIYDLDPTNSAANTEFIDPSIGDFHIKETGSLRTAGINLYPTLEFDIDGDAWPQAGAWDIGYDYFVSVGPPATEVDPVTETLEITTPQVDVVFTPSLDVDVNPVTEELTIITPPVTVQAGLDISVNPVPELLEITTPQVTVEFLPFVNVQPVTVDLTIETPSVEVIEFVDTVVDPVTEVVIIATPQVDVFVGVDLAIDPVTANVEILTPNVPVATPVEYLIATEAQPLTYEVTGAGDVRMDTEGVVNAWRNDIGAIVYPFPAVISSQPADLSVGTGAAISLSVTAIGAAAYQWYLNSGSGPAALIGETAATLNTTAPGTPGIYEYTCVVLNGDDFGIRSKPGTVTVT